MIVVAVFLVGRYDRKRPTTTLAALDILLLLDNKWRHCRSFLRSPIQSILTVKLISIFSAASSGPRRYNIRTFILNKIENNLNIIVGI